MKNDQDILPDLKLRLSIQFPSLEECWNEGFTAAQQAFAEEENPYKAGSLAHEHWIQGWWAGFYEEPNLYSEVADEARLLPTTAANEASWSDESVGRWLGRVAKIAGAIAVTVAAYELADIAV